VKNIFELGLIFDFGLILIFGTFIFYFFKPRVNLSRVIRCFIGVVSQNGLKKGFLDKKYLSLDFSTAIVVRIWAKVEDALSMFFFFKINWGG
jgi:hypothetical protein